MSRPVDLDREPRLVAIDVDDAVGDDHLAPEFVAQLPPTKGLPTAGRHLRPAARREIASQAPGLWSNARVLPGASASVRTGDAGPRDGSVCR